MDQEDTIEDEDEIIIKGLKVIDSEINEVLCQPGRAVLYNYDGTKFSMMGLYGSVFVVRRLQTKQRIYILNQMHKQEKKNCYINFGSISAFDASATSSNIVYLCCDCKLFYTNCEQLTKWSKIPFKKIAMWFPEEKAAADFVSILNQYLHNRSYAKT